MKKSIVITLSFIAFVATIKAVKEKVTICHTRSTPHPHTIVTDFNALNAHLAHGDYIGACQDSELR